MAIGRRVKAGRNASDLVDNGGFNLLRLAWDRPSNTIPKRVCLTGQYAGTLHPSENRLLSIEEVKRLASFPDPFDLIGDFTVKWAALGNSVPPLFMRSIAAHHVHSLLYANDVIQT